MTEDEVEHVEYDWDRVKLLIEIVHELRGYPNLKPLQDAAHAELNAMVAPVEEPEAEPVEEPTDE